jgi:hypothetical protein
VPGGTDAAAEERAEGLAGAVGTRIIRTLDSGAVQPGWTAPVITEEIMSTVAGEQLDLCRERVRALGGYL